MQNNHDLFSEKIKYFTSKYALPDEYYIQYINWNFKILRIFNL